MKIKLVTEIQITDQSVVQIIYHMPHLKMRFEDSVKTVNTWVYFTKICKHTNPLLPKLTTQHSSVYMYGKDCKTVCKTFNNGLTDSMISTFNTHMHRYIGFFISCAICDNDPDLRK